MRRVVSWIGFAVVGLLVGFAASRALLAFSPRCGNDCEMSQVIVWLVVEVAALAIFIGAWYFACRHAVPTITRMLGVCIVTAMAVLAPAGVFYGWNLYSHVRELEASHPPGPSVDFSHMAITTRAVPTLSGAGAPLREIPRWERCLIGVVECTARPRRVEMQCKAGVVSVAEEYWPAFSLIPAENLPGIQPLRSMALCDAGA